MNILLSRTDKIGDVLLTLPMAGVIKKHFPNSTIYFLGRTYTQHVVERSSHIDQFLNWDEIKQGQSFPNIDWFIHVFPDKEIAHLAKKLRIDHRIGTSHRIFHWTTCNKLVHFTRKKSPLHESQLNLKLLEPLGIHEQINLKEIHHYIGWKRRNTVFEKGLLTKKFNLILHTKSMGSAKEWRIENYKYVIERLSTDQVQVYLTGTQEEGELISTECPEIFEYDYVTDVTGKFDLEKFIGFIEKCDGLVACSTGPLHIASSAGIKCIGLYPSKRPMHAGRWCPIGGESTFISEEEESDDPFLRIEAEKVVAMINKKMLN